MDFCCDGSTSSEMTQLSELSMFFFIGKAFFMKKHKEQSFKSF